MAPLHLAAMGHVENAAQQAAALNAWLVQNSAPQLAAASDGAILGGLVGVAASPPVVTAAGTMLCASAVLVPASVLLDRPWDLAPSGKAVAASLVLGVACTGIALLLYFRLGRTLGSLGVASQSYLRAGVGVLLGVLVLGENLTPNVIAGVVAAIAGVVAINWRR